MTQTPGTPSERRRDVVPIIGSIVIAAIMVAILVWLWFYGDALSAASLGVLKRCPSCNAENAR